MDKYVSIVGVGGHAKVIFDLALLNGFTVECFFDDGFDRSNLDLFENRKIAPIDDNFEGPLVIAIGNNEIRKRVSSKNQKTNWQTLVHPSAIISTNVVIGEGSVVMAGAVIQSGSRIGKHCIINTGACVDHDCVIADFVHIGPNSSLAGGVTVEEGTFIGIGSSIIPNMRVGRWAVVGAGSVVISDQPDYCTTVGVPAKPIKFIDEQ